MIATARDLFDMGGWVMWPLLALSVAIWFGLAWRAILLLWQRCDSVERVWSWVAAPVAEVPGRGVQAALCDAWRRDPHPDALEATAAGLRRDVGGGGRVLRAMIQAAPLVGLLGTVTGMIQVFTSLALVGVSAPGLLADGIGQALITTQSGLLIAVPALFVAGQLDRLEASILHGMEQTRLVLCQTRTGEALPCA